MTKRKVYKVKDVAGQGLRLSVPVMPPDDEVDHPAHYTQGGIECIDAIEAAMSPDAYAGYLEGNVIKYLWRHRLKGGAKDLRKARWYLERLCRAGGGEGVGDGR